MSYREHLREHCEACGHDGSFYTLDPDHVKTRGSGGSDEAYNIMTLCRKHHTEKGNKGTSHMAAKYPNYKKWLLDNGWVFNNFLNKWIINKGF